MQLKRKGARREEGRKEGKKKKEKPTPSNAPCVLV